MIYIRSVFSAIHWRRISQCNYAFCFLSRSLAQVCSCQPNLTWRIEISPITPMKNTGSVCHFWSQDLIYSNVVCPHQFMETHLSKLMLALFASFRTHRIFSSCLRFMPTCTFVEPLFLELIKFYKHAYYQQSENALIDFYHDYLRLLWICFHEKLEVFIHQICNLRFECLRGTRNFVVP